MKTTATFLMLIVLIPSILLGYWVGLLAKQPSQPAVPENKYFAASYDQLVPTMPNGQRIFLIAALDKISRAKPSLQGIWLLTYFIDSPVIDLLPIYPAPLPDGTFAGDALASSFGLIKTDDGLALSPTFVLALKERNYEWGGYILMDEIAIEQVFAMVQAKPESASLPGEATDLAAKYQNLAREINRFCEAIQAPNHVPDWALLSELSASHLLSDLSIEDVAAEWQILSDLPGGLRCTPPSSSLVAPATPISDFRNINQ